MGMRRWAILPLCLLGGAAAAEQMASAGELELKQMKLLAVPGIEASGTVVPKADNANAGAFAASALRVQFAKSGDERRLLAFEAPVAWLPTEVKALSVRYRLHLAGGATARLALVAIEGDASSWFKVSSQRLTSAEGFAEARLPLASLKRTTFSVGAESHVRWSRAVKVWVGITLDGAATGTLEISRAVLTDEPYRPTEPLKVTDGGPGTWSVAHDRAATVKTSTPTEGPSGKPCMRLDYAFPGGRHMYVVPSTPLQEVELEGFQALRVTYKGTLPRGIDGLLVMLIERDGTQYYADPAPPASPDWRTVTIPFDRFQRGGWSDDENDRLDLNDVGSVAIGLHGTAQEPQAKGTIWAAEIQFVP